jgi:hypothetical protein
VIAVETPCPSCGRTPHGRRPFCRACGAPQELVGSAGTAGRSWRGERSESVSRSRRTILLLALAAIAIPLLAALVVRAAHQPAPAASDVVSQLALAGHPTDRAVSVVVTPDERSAGVVVSDGTTNRLVVLAGNGKQWHVVQRAAHPSCSTAPASVFRRTGVSCR